MNGRRYLNGKWLAQTPSGTQRYATEVVRAAIETGRATGLTLLVPADAVVPSWAARLPVVRSRLRGAPFEQVALPWLSRRGHLISLAGPAPLLKHDQTLVMHDATPFRHPESFRTAFVWWYRLMYGVLGRSARRVFTVSAFSRSELADVLGLPASRFQLAACGADHVPTTPVEGGEPLPFAERGYLLVVGNLAPHKNPAAAIGALAEGGLPVVVVGGSQAQVFRSVELPKADRVVLTGRVDDERLQQLYAGAAALVAPSRYEGFGIPVVEAGRLGCPSVVASGSALEEVAGEGALTFEPDDLQACATLARRLLDDADLRERLAGRARTNAERFRWADAAEALFGTGGDPAVDDREGRPLRVLHVTETFSAGTGRAIVGYASAVARQDVSSTLLAQDRGSGLLDSLPSSPFADVAIVPGGLRRLWRAVGTQVRQDRPDVVHAHSSLAGAVVRTRLALGGHVPVVYSPHCFALERRDVRPAVRAVFALAERVLARVTDAFVCVSPHEAGLARRLAGQAPVHSLINVLEPLVDAPPRPGHREPTSLRVVSVGRVAPQKDPALFAAIVGELARVQPGVVGRWIGDGTDAAALEALRSAGIQVTGWLDAYGLAAELAAADAYLHAASWEAGPIAVLDALQAELPIVVRRIDAYAGWLPPEWQFDTPEEAVSMLTSLRDGGVRAVRLREQRALLAALEERGPGAVLGRVYREVALGGRAGRARRSGGATSSSSYEPSEVKEGARV